MSKELNILNVRDTVVVYICIALARLFCRV
jgi:hypothetical protein